MAIFYSVVEDDPLDNGGKSRVIQGASNCTIQGDDGRHRGQTFIGHEAYCDVCKSTGPIMAASGSPDTLRMYDLELGEREALEGDLVICKCERHPKIISVHGRSSRIVVASLASEELERMNATRGGFVTVSPPVSSSPNSVPENSRLGGDTALADMLNAQAKTDCSYLDGTKNRIDAPASFYRRTNRVTVAPGKQTEFKFPGGGLGKATQYDATIGEKVVPIYIPGQSAPQGAALVSQSQIANALEILPAQHLEHIGKISANSMKNPADDYWIKRYGDESFASAATANIEQGIAFYPWKGWTSIPQRYVDSTMLHETGHQVSEMLWKDPEMKQSWLDAVTSDGNAPSQYAQNNENEDFAESANMYWSSKGTPCEPEGRKRYPARYTYFDKITQ